jgi:hypothetical protein
MKFAFFFLLVFASLFTSAQAEDWKGQMFGSIASIDQRLTTYQLDDSGKVYFTKHERFYAEFNKNDSLTKYIDFQNINNDEVFKTIIITYNENNQILTRETKYSGDKILESYFYDASGLLIKWVQKSDTYESDKITYIIELEYNANHQVILRKESDSEEGYLGKTTITYDERGNKIEEKTVDANDEVVQLITDAYNDAGQLILHETYLNGRRITKQEYTYNDAGNLESLSSEYGALTTEDKVVEEYDSLGRAVKVTNYQYGDLKSYYIIEYPNENHYISKLYDKKNSYICTDEMKQDEFGNIIFSGQYFIKKSESYNIVYEFDQMNNWTRSKTYDQNNRLCIEVSREIVYH